MAKPRGTVQCTYYEDGLWQLALHGEHDLSTAPQLEKAMQTALGGGTTVIVDLTNATFIDSSVINWLARQNRHTHHTHGPPRIALVTAPPDTGIGRLVDLFKLDQIMPVYPTPQAALVALGTTANSQAAAAEALRQADERLDHAWNAKQGVEEALFDAKELSRLVGRDPVIEDAKVVLACRYGCDTATAFDLLKVASQRANRKLRDIAHEITETAAAT